MKIRDMLAVVDADHDFTLTEIPSPGIRNTANIVNLSCSCGWATGRAIHEVEITSGYSKTLTSEWSDREQLQHLLDQDMDVYAVLDLLVRKRP